MEVRRRDLPLQGQQAAERKIAACPSPRLPLCTVDAIIELLDHPHTLAHPTRPAFVLIERKHAPLGWAIPGGFVDIGEPLWQAAVREALEETSLHVTLREQLFAYSRPDRDPRGTRSRLCLSVRRTVSLRAADDAKNVQAFTEETLPELAFDHGEILADYFEFRRSGRRPPFSRAALVLSPTAPLPSSPAATCCGMGMPRALIPSAESRCFLAALSLCGVAACADVPSPPQQPWLGETRAIVPGPGLPPSTPSLAIAWARSRTTTSMWCGTRGASFGHAAVQRSLRLQRQLHVRVLFRG